MADDKNGRLRMMRFWLIGVFLIILAAQLTTGFLFQSQGIPLMGELYFWLGLIIAAVLVVIWYFAYQWWIGRK